MSDSPEGTNIMSDNAALICQWILLTCLCQSIDIFGIGSNVINIICFAKQGFKDPINISLMGLAVSDLGCLSTLIWTNICCTPAFMTADLPFDSIEFHYLTSGVPHTVFTRVTGCITAFITLERCMCITMPLKVKNIITSKRVSVITILIFLILMSTVAPEYVVNKIGYKYFPHRNKTLIGLVYTKDRAVVAKVSYGINNVFIPFTSFAVIISCTTILVTRLQMNTQWRTHSTPAVQQTQAVNISDRNQKVSKMVVMISTLFIACFVPVSIMFIAISLEPELFINGAYRNISIVLGAFGIILESINSSVNIFFYYSMSRNYRAAFRQLFDVCQK